MRGVATRLAEKFAATREVAVADCVHFCAYRYGHDEPNPYERYAMGLSAGMPIDAIRERFIDAVSRYRPRDLGEALGVVLSHPYPLWWLPWRTPGQAIQSPGWVADASKVIDVMTHFAHEGIPRGLLEREFEWHENAFSGISRHGYQPHRYSYITARELRGERSCYLLTDGNHRVSALSALGIASVAIRLPVGSTVIRANVAQWPMVRTGMMTRDDALSVFDAYHHGNRMPVASAPAPIVA